MDLNYKEYYALLTAADGALNKQTFISENIGPILREGNDPATANGILSSIWTYRYTPYTERAAMIRGLTGMTRAEFARAFGLPKRTLENWEAPWQSSNHRRPPANILDLLLYAALTVVHSGRR